MKKYEITTVPMTYRALVATVCDLCGVEKPGGDWSARGYEVKETEIKVTVKHREGENYPEGGSGTEYEIDLCPECFKGRLVPWLISQGANIKEEEWDW